MQLEFELLDMIQALRSPVGDAIMVFITNLGNGGIIWILTAAVLLFIPKTRKAGVVMAVTLCLDAILCNGILKNLFARIRPCDIRDSVQLLIARPDDFSFPSGHTAASFAAVAALFFSGKRKLWKPAFVLAVLIAFSRLYLYVHFPTDILGGIVLGVLCGYVAYWGVNKASINISQTVTKRNTKKRTL